VTRAPRLSSKELLRILENDGYKVVSTRGSHCKLRRDHDNRTVIVPLGRDPLKLGTQSDILRQAAITPDRLSQLL
jgi:predicted RNA binding protein YcfA (HicA-like mRNA interferase family)